MIQYTTYSVEDTDILLQFPLLVGELCLEEFPGQLLLLGEGYLLCQHRPGQQLQNRHSHV